MKGRSSVSSALGFSDTVPAITAVQTRTSSASGSSTSFDVHVRLGHYGATSLGRAWFDDVRLEAIP